MDNRWIDELFKDIFSVLPVFNKKIFGLGDDLLKEKGISRPHIKIIFSIKKHERVTGTDLAKVLSVPKSNITNWVDKLVEIGMVRRIFDNNDRRLTFVELTEEGEKFLNAYMETLKNSFGHKLWNFSEADLRLFEETLNNMKELLSKIREEE